MTVGDTAGTPERRKTTAVYKDVAATDAEGMPTTATTMRFPQCARRPRNQPYSVYTAYLRMGFLSARCLWRQYLEADTEHESQLVRERFKGFVRFWTTAIGVSVAILWSAYGFFHQLVCFGINAPPVTYAKDVNKYLTMVPPQVVVTGKGKVFRYRPTAEERFLWKSAKKIANFKI